MKILVMDFFKQDAKVHISESCPEIGDKVYNGYPGARPVTEKVWWPDATMLKELGMPSNHTDIDVVIII